MSYTIINFKTKKALKEAVELANKKVVFNIQIPPIRCYNPSLGPDLSNYTGTVYISGPHYPEPHRWYAEGELVNGILVKVK